MKILVKTLGGDIIRLDVEPTTTIEEIKKKIQELKNIQVEEQIITFKNKRLENNRTVSYYNIQDKNTLYMLVRMLRHIVSTTAV